MKKIVILRLGHRINRDQRMTTHVALTARALGADGVLLASSDKSIEQKISDVTKRWGGEFYVRSDVKWRTEIKKWKECGGKVCHLTMYGINLEEEIDAIRDTENLMVIVGAEKVPAEIFTMADWNISITNQPHSEVAALAIFMDHLQKGEELKKEFRGGRLQIVARRVGKEVKGIKNLKSL
ncbi:MAG: tRNA (cytidine(56)-2'-O)-methyltransferase [Methanocellales archaeon]|nr:tRNA (cytidine(56)-2'-O)-methyltransferase [Methanocellales archaeon]MDD3421686.1 tRNA (cytidine(56)-2'-O)-methyltransferase [Methanocellales archaeon]MDD4898714.1 tRNA (cytidine(56)-2'-O)-methyltransferase [Methanocellales archaeon]MDD5446563.1 tRNA (cytidine(56)-2'-O)-methyltransferase [Methanocellales archaeon]